MISTVGMNFMMDSYSMDTVGLYRNEIKTLEIMNGIIDQLYIENGIDKPYEADYNTDWDFLTIMSAGFDNTLSAGNIDYMLGLIKGIRLKRRKVGGKEWALLAEYSLSPNSTLKFELEDLTSESNTEYEYAVVPVLTTDNGEKEADYMVNKIMTQFDGVYICDKDTIYRFYAGVSFGNSDQKNITGIYEPMGRKYPIVVANGVTNYYKSSLKATVITDDNLFKNKLDRKPEVEYRKKIMDFLTNHKPKIIKDWNGNSWLVMIVDSPSIQPNNRMGFGYADVEFDFVEVGDSNSTKDLLLSKMIKG